MTYDEAVDLMYKSKWKTSCCSQGKQCWCRIVEPVKFIANADDDEKIYISGAGMLTKRAAEYFVKLHNKNIKENKK